MVNNLEYADQSANGLVLDYIPIKVRGMDFSYGGIDKVSVSPVMTLLGANACGKSNILKALIVLKKLVESGFDFGLYTPFVFDEFGKKLQDRDPTEFKLLFDTNGFVYEYFVSFNKYGFCSEALYVHDGTDSNPIKVFDTDDSDLFSKEIFPDIEVNEQEIIYCSKIKNISLLYLLEDAGKLGTSFYEHVKNAFEFIKSGIVGSDDVGTIDLPPDVNEARLYISKIKYILWQMGFDNVDIILDESLTAESNIDKVFMVYKLQDGSLCFMNLKEHESTGTQNLFRFIKIIIDVVSKGGVIIYDEIDRTIHTELLRYLFSIFINKEVNSNSQLICSSHNPCVLYHLGPACIGLVEKKNFITKIRYLSGYELKPNEDLLKSYLRGDFGAKPRSINYLNADDFKMVGGKDVR